MPSGPESGMPGAAAVEAEDELVEVGAHCVGCCWALMALLFVGGVMNVLWIATISAKKRSKEERGFHATAGRELPPLFIQ
jgi:predicted metal-binding membrane protein